jgi:peptidoglycan/LPS O-acetylase OafA/YrhL
VEGPDAERAILSGPLHGAISLLLPMFFALSGFLVCASLDRSRGLIPFIVHRILRIVPALTVVVVLSALVLGPLMTTLTLAQYFSRAESYQYLLNIIGSIHFQLPGVFMDTPEQRTVNASLWTIRYELGCYMALALLASVGFLKHVRVMSFVVILSWAVCTALLLWHGSVKVAMESGTSGHFLVVCFLAGTVIFLLRDKLLLPGPAMLLISGVLSYGLLSRPESAFLAPFPVAYLTVCLGLMNPPRIPVFSDGDFSYGLYLIAFPIQQTYSALFPHQRTWSRDVVISMALSFSYAFLSWHLVEKPVIRHRKRIVVRVQAVASYILARLQPESVAARYRIGKKPSVFNSAARADEAPL